LRPIIIGPLTLTPNNGLKVSLKFIRDALSQSIPINFLGNYSPDVLHGDR
jgi:hypothetical protein